ncbi:putative 60S ribosomal protein L28e [Lachnellula suecica]|uniref:Putative 60S ribosomal protein L28e n=1 Tax=Lachnellula suecica TaxID=602035 RepID=A0A8T9C810_9HELO|nr:putative 60S ribosomal protein L28e [Lachnellula suecica]
MAHHSSQVSADLLWEITRNQNAFLVKRAGAGGLRFSRDPLNLVNIHSRKNAGFVNDKAVGVLPLAGEKGGVTLITKKAKHPQRPAHQGHKTNLSGSKSSRKISKTVAANVAKTGYRPDLRAHAVSRASAILKSQKTPKDLPESKPRGAKAKKAAAEKEE